MSDVHVLSVITRLGRGGSERRLYDVLAAVPAAHTVVVGADSDPDVVAALAADVEVLRCDPLVRQVAPADDRRALARLVQLVRAGRYDVVHTHQSKAGLLGRLAARANPGRRADRARPVVYHSSSMASFGPGYGRGESLAFAAAERATAPLVDRFFVVGDDLAGRIRANGVADRRIEIVRSSLDLAPFAAVDAAARTEARRRLGIEANARVVAYVGSLDERKNVALLPDAVGRATAGGERPGATLLVAGSGPLADQLAAAAEGRADGVEIRLLGHVGDVAGVMAAADVLALPSSAEGLPQVLVQAARAGLAFVAFDVDGVGELLALGARGRAVPLGDEGAFADALRSQLSELAEVAGPDEAVWRQWDPAVVAERYRHFYGLDLMLDLTLDLGNRSAPA